MPLSEEKFSLPVREEYCQILILSPFHSPSPTASFVVISIAWFVVLRKEK